MNVARIIAEVRQLAPIYTIMNMVKGVFDDQSHANELYRELWPILQDYLMRGSGYDDPHVKHIVNILRELPPYGAKRINFEKYYLKDESGLRRLPRNPDDIPYGYWH